MGPPRPRLTACVLARDEEQLLPACLESLRGVVDEVLVVDTGSVDRTVELARCSGARLVHHPWGEDFSAARNAGLEQVPDGWVLVLDADERLAPGSGAALRAATAAGHLDAGWIARHDADTLEATPREVIGGRARRGEPLLALRLLRRTPDLAFEGLVEEDLRTWLRAGRKVAALDVGLVHYGDVPELGPWRDRSGSRLELLERRCGAEPGNARVRALLAQERLRRGDEAGSREQAERAWRLLLAAPAPDRHEADLVLAATLQAFQALAREDLDRAAEVLARTAELGVSHPNLDLLTGALLEGLALTGVGAGEQAEALAGARAAYLRCLEQSARLFECRPLPGASSWAARTRLATVDLLCGRPDDALRGFDRALEDRPTLLEARLGRLEALLDLGLAPEVLQGLEPWLAGGSPDAWTLAAAAAAALGSPGDASLFAGRAHDACSARPWAGPHRRLRLEALAALPA